MFALEKINLIGDNQQPHQLPKSNPAQPQKQQCPTPVKE
jgi:hypothetical protein